MRPFTAKWHQLSVDGRLSSADVRFEFRRELAALQPWLRDLTHLLGLLAGDIPQVAESEAKPTKQAASAIPGLWNELSFGVAAGIQGTDAIRDEINAREGEEIKGRRAFYFLGNADRSTDAVGLSISGGGIRSATFALGAIQLLARKGILYQVDYLSTVSGGGYLGSFISSFLNDKDSRLSLKPETGAQPFGAEGDGESQGVRQLRNHGKYLIEGGLKTLVTIAGLVVYGLLVSVLLFSPFLLSSVLITGLLFDKSFSSLPRYLPMSLEAAGAFLVLGILFLPLVQRGRWGPLHRWWGRSCIGLGFLCLLLRSAETLPHMLTATSKIGPSVVLFLALKRE